MVFRFVDLMKLGEKPPLEIITFLQDRGLITRTFKCPVCDKDMVLSTIETISDKYRWQCRRCKTTRSARIGSWFSNSRMPMTKILHITYCWIHKYTQPQVQWELECTPPTTVNWYHFCREICVKVVLKERGQIGGPGTIVEVDESKFGKRKYYKGKHIEGLWVFGGIERGSNRCFLTKVDDRSPATFVPLIKEFIAPGTTIVSDCWKAYDSLGAEGYRHLTVDHSLTFEDTETDACTNAIEGLWTSVKRQLPEYNRNRGMFSSYLGEFMYRRLRANVPDPFETFMQDIARVYPPPSNDADAAEVTDAAEASGSGS